MPAADLPVDADLVGALLRDQHPDLADLPLRPVAAGWDALVLRLGADLAVRIPRRAVAAGLILHEQAALPAIAADVAVPVPLPVRTGVPSARFPWPWSVVPWFEGEPVAALPLRGDLRLADDLGAFVAALHRPVASSAPNPYRGVPLAARAQDVAARLAHPDLPDRPGLAAAWSAALAAPPWAGPPMRLHGDLHPGNLLARDGRLAAVIDFGDTTGGDPACDLAAAWLTFDGDARERFRRVVAPDAATWTRARGWAVAIGAAVVLEPDGGALLHATGRAALREVLADG